MFCSTAFFFLLNSVKEWDAIASITAGPPETMEYCPQKGPDVQGQKDASRQQQGLVSIKLPVLQINSTIHKLFS